MKKFIFSVFTLALLLGSSYVIKNYMNQPKPNDLVLANIEALARGEGDGEQAYCWTQFTGGLAWQDNVQVVYVCHLRQE